MPSIEEDLKETHYKPAGKSDWCHAMRRAFDRNDHSWDNISCSTNIDKVTCPHCLAKILATLKWKGILS